MQKRKTQSFPLSPPFPSRAPLPVFPPMGRQSPAGTTTQPHRAELCPCELQQTLAPACPPQQPAESRAAAFSSLAPGSSQASGILVAQPSEGPGKVRAGSIRQLRAARDRFLWLQVAELPLQSSGSSAGDREQRRCPQLRAASCSGNPELGCLQPPDFPCRCSLLFALFFPSPTSHLRPEELASPGHIPWGAKQRRAGREIPWEV